MSRQVLAERTRQPNRCVYQIQLTLFTVTLSAMVADVIGEAFLGNGRFLSGFAAGITPHRPASYLLVAARLPDRPRLSRIKPGCPNPFR